MTTDPFEEKAIELEATCSCCPHSEKVYLRIAQALREADARATERAAGIVDSGHFIHDDPILIARFMMIATAIRAENKKGETK